MNLRKAFKRRLFSSIFEASMKSLYISVVKIGSGNFLKKDLSRLVTTLTSFHLGSSSLMKQSSPLVLT